MKTISYLKITFREPVRVVETALQKQAVVAAAGVTLTRIIDGADDRLEVASSGSASFEVPWHMVASAMRSPDEPVPATEPKAKPSAKPKPEAVA